MTYHHAFQVGGREIPDFALRSSTSISELAYRSHMQGVGEAVQVLYYYNYFKYDCDMG